MIEYFKDHLFIYQISIKLVPTRMNNLPDFEQNTVTLNSKTLSHLINTIQGCPLIITICSLNVLWIKRKLIKKNDWIFYLSLKKWLNILRTIFLSSNWCNGTSFWWNTRAFLSIQITHTQESHMILKAERLRLENPPKVPNWNKWSDTCSGNAMWNLSQWEISYHSLPKKSQEKNKCFV